MASSLAAPFSISCGSHVKVPEIWLTKRNLCVVGFGPKLNTTVQRKSNSLVSKNRRSSPPICAQYRDNSGGGGGGADFVAGFLLGGAVLGTVAYIFAPQIRRFVLNEDEYGFRKAKRLTYYDEGLENTRQTLNKKMRQLNSAIDNVSSRLRHGKNVPATQKESDPEVEATMFKRKNKGRQINNTIRRSVLNEDRLESTGQTLNEKMTQLSSAIENIYSHLRHGRNVPAAQKESDPEVEATM